LPPDGGTIAAMKFDIELPDALPSIAADETQRNLSTILDGLAALRLNINHQPEILYWIERAVVETEKQLRMISPPFH
jgi:hypothetical protein